MCSITLSEKMYDAAPSSIGQVRVQSRKLRVVALTLVMTQPSRGSRPPISSFIGRGAAANARRARTLAIGVFTALTVALIAERIRGVRRRNWGFREGTVTPFPKLTTTEL